LESTWKQDSDAARRDLIRSLETALGMEDEPFLERALDDRDVLVRRKAAELLAALPGSRLCQRMTAAAGEIMVWTPRQATQVSVHFPPTISDSLARDGVLRPAAADATANERARMLIHIISAIPLDHWPTAWGVAAAEVVRGVQTSKWPRTLMTALTTAAMRQRDVAWARALLAQDGYSERCGRLIALLPPELCFAETRRQLEAVSGQPSAVNEPLTAAHPLLRFLRYWPHEWDEPTSRLWIDFLVGQAQLEQESKAIPTLRYLMRNLARQCVPGIAGYATEVLAAAAFSDGWRQTFKTFLATLNFRAEMMGTIDQ
jgi:hypothetical protein